jgi:hypothetical protein
VRWSIGRAPAPISCLSGGCLTSRAGGLPPISVPRLQPLWGPPRPSKGSKRQNEQNGHIELGVAYSSKHLAPESKRRGCRNDILQVIATGGFSPVSVPRAQSAGRSPKGIGQPSPGVNIVKELVCVIVGAYLLYTYSRTFRTMIDDLLAEQPKAHATASPKIISDSGGYKDTDGVWKLKSGYHWVYPNDKSDRSTYYDDGSYKNANGKLQLKPGCRWVTLSDDDYHTTCSAPTYTSPSYDLPSTTTTTTRTRTWRGPADASPPGCGGLDAAHCL